MGKKSTFSLILMDCNMPVMDGYLATQIIREIYFSFGIPQPIIIACTGHCEKEYIKKALEAGMNQILSKPIKA